MPDIAKRGLISFDIGRHISSAKPSDIRSDENTKKGKRLGIRIFAHNKSAFFDAFIARSG